MARCEHTKTKNIYEQLPPSQARAWKKVEARLCVDCQAVVRFDAKQQRWVA